MPEKVMINQELFEALSGYCISRQPFEACGILTGKQMNADGGQWIQIDGFLPVKNVSCSPERTFELDPETWVRHMSDDCLREQTIGVFHSHPSAPPVPSAEDLRGLWEFPVYLILSLADSIPQARSYRFIPGQCREESLMIRNGLSWHKDPLSC